MLAAVGALIVLAPQPCRAEQPDEFSLPQFAIDAGTPEPPPAPPPFELPEDDTRGVPPPELDPTLAPPAPPPPPTWARLGVSATLVATALTTYFFGGDLAVLVTALGTPEHSKTVPGEVEGWVMQVGLEGGYGRAGGALCDGAIFCASRAFGGLVLKTGFARGLPHLGDSITRLQTFYFAQAEAALSHYDIPSAPLAPGVKTFELLTRLRFGLHLTSESNRRGSTGVTLMIAAIVEGVPVSKGTQGIAFGLSAGAGF
ncbi:MAG: hypothetical protein U0228_39250 [Myxococcaceae bacterium]